jgi:hypothetical protein
VGVDCGGEEGSVDKVGGDGSGDGGGGGAEVGSGDGDADDFATPKKKKRKVTPSSDSVVLAKLSSCGVHMCESVDGHKGADVMLVIVLANQATTKRTINDELAKGVEMLGGHGKLLVQLDPFTLGAAREYLANSGFSVGKPYVYVKSGTQSNSVHGNAVYTLEATIGRGHWDASAYDFHGQALRQRGKNRASRIPGNECKANDNGMHGSGSSREFWQELIERNSAPGARVGVTVANADVVVAALEAGVELVVHDRRGWSAIDINKIEVPNSQINVLASTPGSVKASAEWTRSDLAELATAHSRKEMYVAASGIGDGIGKSGSSALVPYEDNTVVGNGLFAGRAIRKGTKWPYWGTVITKTMGNKDTAVAGEDRMVMSLLKAPTSEDRVYYGVQGSPECAVTYANHCEVARKKTDGTVETVKLVANAALVTNMAYDPDIGLVAGLTEIECSPVYVEVLQDIKMGCEILIHYGDTFCPICLFDDKVSCTLCSGS